MSVSADEFEAAVDAFLEQVTGQLEAEGVRGTNLEAVWREVLAERSDPEAALRRTLEALLGHDPGDADDAEVERFVRDGAALGTASAMEVAAASQPLHAGDFQEMAASAGEAIAFGDAARLSPKAKRSLPRTGPAWLRRVVAAKALRRQESLGQQPISDHRLSAIAGVGSRSPMAGQVNVPLTFALHMTRGREDRVVLRPRSQHGRRFDLSRLIGDRIATDDGGRLRPVTRADTYRQKLQRSFAAELLAPFDAVRDMLGDNLSDEAQEEVADHFGVSFWVVRNQLVNNGLLGRDDASPDNEAVADRGSTSALSAP